MCYSRIKNNNAIITATFSPTGKWLFLPLGRISLLGLITISSCICRLTVREQQSSIKTSIYDFTLKVPEA